MREWTMSKVMHESCHLHAQDVPIVDAKTWLSASNPSRHHTRLVRHPKGVFKASMRGRGIDKLCIA
jgi:hypothetical protein